VPHCVNAPQGKSLLDVRSQRNEDGGREERNGKEWIERRGKGGKMMERRKGRKKSVP
jgi:hypothetical protein